MNDDASSLKVVKATTVVPTPLAPTTTAQAGHTQLPTSDTTTASTTMFGPDLSRPGLREVTMVGRNWVIVTGYGCQSENHFVGRTDALEACSERQDCLGVHNSGCSME